MSWSPPERPEWVRAINADTIAPISEEAALPLERDALILEAAARQGYATGSTAPFDHPDFPAEAAFDSLQRFLDALREETALTTMGRWMTRRFLLRLLEVRLQIMAYLERDPGVQEEEILTPLFVAGAPRTGTTILHTLLATDTRHRVPLGWELLRPVPPPSPDPAEFAADPRIALADRELVRPQTVVSGLLSIHEYGGGRPKECLSAMSLAFQSEEFTARYAVPSFERWLETSDMGAAYRMHKLVLQILQRRKPGSAWILKSPVHLHDLPTLFETYPDARVAVTHRDPTTLLASLTSLIANLRWAHSDLVSPEQIAESHIRRYQRTLSQLVTWTEEEAFPRNQVHHSHFEDFRKAPIETVRELYDKFEIPWLGEVETAMRASLEKNPSDRHGEHAYSPEDLGVDLVALRESFSRYQTYFEVPSNA